MIKDFLINTIKKNVSIELTDSQLLLIENISCFLQDDIFESVFILKGFAGTGKTTMISIIVNALKGFKKNVVLLAPTGRAAKVMSSYCSDSAFTIHKQIYREKVGSDLSVKFELAPNLMKDTFFFVDEASMISNSIGENSIFGSGFLLDDLFQYVYNGKNCKLVLIGDLAQLPPIGLSISPALIKKDIERFGRKVYETTLTQVVRQDKLSGILFNANIVRKIFESGNTEVPKFQVQEYQDIERVSGVNLIEKITENYDKYGEKETIIITRSNKRANKFNKGIRSMIMDREAQVSKGDMVMIVKNNYFWLEKNNEKIEFLANGDVAEILRVRTFNSIYGFNFADARLRLIDNDFEFNAKILVDTIESESPSLTYDENKRLYEAVMADYVDIKSKKQKYIKLRENMFFNALQIKFAYSVTCHKSQGGQWACVFIDYSFIKVVDIEYIRWLYTALTRATKKVYLINFPDEYFKNA